MLGVLEAGGYQLARINVPDLTHIPKIWKSPGFSFIYHILLNKSPSQSARELQRDVVYLC